MAIARAIVKMPLLVLADEPTANLDQKTSHEILDLMQQLNRQDKITFVFSTHDSMVLSRAQSVTHLVDGQNVVDAGVKHVA